MPLPSETLAPTLALPLICKPSQDTSLEGRWLIVDANGRKLFLSCPDVDAERRAKEMVEACNAHADAVALAKRLFEYFGDGPILPGLDTDIWLRDAAKALLAKVEATP